ncbi:MAG TPA: hypothetical protein PKE31_03555 [Pseudomonadota bacterium]|nr:hypothetical protein [Pseudomonadota bacterium]
MSAQNPAQKDTSTAKDTDIASRRFCAVLSGLLAVSLVTMSGCGPARPYYAGYMFKPPRIEESDRSEMVRFLDKQLRVGAITRIDIETPDEGLKTLQKSDADTANTDWLPLPVLYAAEFVLLTKRKGLELDLLTHLSEKEFVPVTARYELDGQLSVVVGKSIPSLIPLDQELPSKEQMQNQYGVGAIVDGARVWKPYELYSLDRALSFLSDEERKVIRGVRFVRDAVSESRNRWCQYLSTSNPEEPRVISLFDVKAGTDTAQFIGDPNQPHPLPSMCFLHEVGHAIADVPRLRMDQQHEQYKEEAVNLMADYTAIEATGQLVSPEADEIRARLVDWKRRKDEHEKAHDRLRAAYRRTDGPVCAAYRAVRGPDKGPTTYGRKDVAESFAESFALYKADKEALRRIYPEVLDWFLAGGHLQAMAKDE